MAQLKSSSFKLLVLAGLLASGMFNAEQLAFEREVPQHVLNAHGSRCTKYSNRKLLQLLRSGVHRLWNVLRKRLPRGL